MMYKQFLITTAFACALFSTSCSSSNKISEDDCISLIVGVSEIPLKNDFPANGNYYEFLDKTGDKHLTNCLLGQITNVTQVPDPRLSVPGRRSSVAIGDISIFMLSEMYDIPFTTFIDEAEWKHIGIYAYFKYMESDGARDKVAEIYRKRLTNSG